MRFDHLLGKFSEVDEHSDGGYIALCPAHGDSNPSLRLWRGEDLKVRLTCRAGCPPERVIKAVGLTFSDLFNAYGDGSTVSKDPPELAGAEPMQALADYVHRRAVEFELQETQVAGDAADYVNRRFGLSIDAARELSIGVDDGEYDYFSYRSRSFKQFPRVTVPLYDFEGVPRGLQGRDITGGCPARWVSINNPKGKRWSAYGVFRGHGNYSSTIVTEGPGDALSSAAVGYDSVAVRGAALAGSASLLSELANGLSGAQVVVCGDADQAGQGFIRKLSDGLRRHGITVYVLTLPTGFKDLSAWQEARPESFAAELHSAVKAARPVADAERQNVTDELAKRTGADTVSANDGNEAARILSELVERYGESDAMNAYALVAWTGGRIRYAPNLGFFVWNGHVWEPSETKVRQEVHKMGAALVLAGKLHESKGFTMTTRIDSLLTELRSVPSVYVGPDDFDSHPDLLCFQNGTVELRTGVLRDHRMEDLMTRQLDVAYRPDAECPRWLAFLDEIFPENPELSPYMQRLTGYGITGHTSEQCFAVLQGKGANGKSVFTETLTNVFGKVTRITPFATFEEKPNGGIPNDLAALRGARLVMASEGEAGRPMGESVLKKLTGKDRISARFLRKEFFEFAPTFLIMLATNHKPKFRGQDEGLWRRVKLIPFTRWFAPHERDYDLDRKLLAEAEGIAAWAVRGAVEWYKGGLQDPEIISSETREYRETSDILAGFFPGVVEVEDGTLLAGALAYNEYQAWCEEEGLTSKDVMSRRTFYDAMAERGVTKRAKGRLPGYQGVILEGVRLAHKTEVAGPGIFAK